MARVLADTLRRSHKDAVIDLAEVEILDSPVLGAMVKAKDAYTSAGLALGLCGLSRVVAHIFRCLHLDLRFPIYADVGEAAAHLRPKGVETGQGKAIVTLCSKTGCGSYLPSRTDRTGLCTHPRRHEIEDTRRCRLFHTGGPQIAGGPAPALQVRSSPIAHPHPPRPQAPPSPTPRAAPAAAHPAPRDTPSPATVVRAFIESLNQRDWRKAYDAMAPEFAQVTYDEYRQTREAYYRKMSESGRPPEQYLVRLETSEVWEGRALLRCIRLDISGWGRNEYPQDYALELREGRWLITRIFTGGRSRKDRRGDETTRPAVQDRRSMPNPGAT